MSMSRLPASSAAISRFLILAHATPESDTLCKQATLAEIASDEDGDVPKAATGDPRPKRSARTKNTKPNQKQWGKS
jgi:hypothetical protein